MHENDFGQICNLIDHEHACWLFDMMKMNCPRNEGKMSEFWGEDIKDPGKYYWWFVNNVVGPLLPHLEPQGYVKLIGVCAANLTDPYKLHVDTEHHRNYKMDGEPYMSIIIPISVDNDYDKITRAQTVFEVQWQDEPYALDWWAGNLLWFRTDLRHGSGEFKGYDTKQFIVAHTSIS